MKINGRQDTTKKIILCLKFCPLLQLTVRNVHLSIDEETQSDCNVNLKFFQLKARSISLQLESKTHFVVSFFISNINSLYRCA